MSTTATAQPVECAGASRPGRTHTHRPRPHTRLIVLALIVVLIASSCHRYGSWHRPGGHPTVIHVQSTPAQAGAVGHAAIVYGADAWSKASPYLDIRVVSKCPNPNRCVINWAQNGSRTARTSHPSTTWPHLLVSIIVWQGDWGSASLAYAAFAGVHELGHALGLGHADGTGLPGSRTTLRPTKHDLEEIAYLYSHVD